ncbi:hypothetical protein D9M68_964690 [compost metagenome]
MGCAAGVTLLASASGFSSRSAPVPLMIHSARNPVALAKAIALSALRVLVSPLIHWVIAEGATPHSSAISRLRFPDSLMARLIRSF